MKRIAAVFFRTAASGEPVRDWLKSLQPVEDCQRIGADIATVEFGWPVGMPTCRPLKDGLYEVRTNLTGGKIGRVLFYIDERSRMVLLHKKVQKTPHDDLELDQLLDPSNTAVSLETLTRAANVLGKRLVIEIRDELPVRPTRQRPAMRKTA